MLQYSSCSSPTPRSTFIERSETYFSFTDNFLFEFSLRQRVCGLDWYGVEEWFYVSENCKHWVTLWITHWLIFELETNDYSWVVLTFDSLILMILEMICDYSVVYQTTNRWFFPVKLYKSRSSWSATYQLSFSLQTLSALFFFYKYIHVIDYV